MLPAELEAPGPRSHGGDGVQAAAGSRVEELEGGPSRVELPGLESRGVGISELDGAQA